MDYSQLPDDFKCQTVIVKKHAIQPRVCRRVNRGCWREIKHSPSFPRGFSIIFIFACFVIYTFARGNCGTGKGRSPANFRGHICRLVRDTIRFVSSIRQRYLRSLTVGRRRYLISRKRGEKREGWENPTRRARRRFRSSTSRHDAVKPVEDKRACRIGVYQTTRIIECSSERN